MSNPLRIAIASGKGGTGKTTRHGPMVLVVTEPSLSGLHDLKRVAELTRQFNIETAVCINKFDINTELSDRIERESGDLHLPVIGRVHYDEAVTRAQVNRKSVVENGDGPAARDIRALREQVNFSRSARIKHSQDTLERKGQ